MPDTLPQSAVSAAQTIAAIREKLAMQGPAIDPVMQPSDYGEMIGESYRSMALAVYDAAMALARCT